MRIAILGFGREGRAVFKYLKTNKAYKNAGIFVLDKKLSPVYLKNLKQFDIIFRSPGIPYNLPAIQAAKLAGVKITSATKLFFEIAARQNIHIIGVTGTKGKGTTSTLLYKIFQAAKRPVVLAGNIGQPAITILPRLKPKTTVILELSSFQLQDLDQSPQTSVVLEIFPDHLDSHKNFAEYLAAKSSIAAHQKNGDGIFYASGNGNAKHIAGLSKGKITAVSEKNWALFSRADLKIPGEHNFKNAIMASTIALAHGLPRTAVLRAVKNFHGLPHRLELVKELKFSPNTPPDTTTKNTTLIPLIRPNEGNDKNIKNVDAVVGFYNDSASTNPQTSAAAIRAFQEPTILIAGGKDKNLDYLPLARAVREAKNLKAIVLFGENKPKIKGCLSLKSGRVVTIKLAKDLKSAVASAVGEAKKLANLRTYKLINIVFSPGAASFDMFKDYADRGEKFKKIVARLK